MKPADLCKAHRDMRGTALGICVACERRNDKVGQLVPPAVRDEVSLVWSCPARIVEVPDIQWKLP